ncbi:MAG: chemotaxis protein CheB [Xanthomonadaceae bacterium]|nr:chemotaxis protein CheB [Xanthomonadaceae bacterium]MDE3073029.1 chemotaxis protein CheB [Pseudomonadota bacterium]
MTDPALSVVLLFDDTELGGQLREALQDCGARIVHEGGISGISRELLRELGAEVLVVNLDDTGDDALDQLYDVIDGDHPRVVFNDAQASRALAGWDRARWARHLALKVLAVGDVDPPRPQDARGIEMPRAAGAGEPVPVDAPNEVTAAGAAATGAAGPYSLEQVLPEAAEGDEGPRRQIGGADSENLEAELEAMLASDDPQDNAEETSGPGLRYTDGNEPPPLHDGNFGVAQPTAAVRHPDLAAARDVEAPPPVAPVPESNVFQLDHRSAPPPAEPPFAPLSDTEIDAIPVASLVTPPRAPDDWALLADDETPAAGSVHVAAGKPDPAVFGVEKMSAADFLAPDVEQVAPDVRPVLNLELVSLEEAVAPQQYEQQPANEMMLGELGSALNRIVLLGAAVDSTDSVCGFLAALPASTRLTFLHAQHLGNQSAAALVEKLSAHCALPVRLAERAAAARAGEVLVISAGQHVRLRRDGSIEITAQADGAAQDPSIDATFSMAANAFGRDALAIVFAGRSTDAVAGAQAIHDRGGQVWVESSSGEHFADMVSGIFAERLVSFSGAPHELAAHLIEVFP